MSEQTETPVATPVIPEEKKVEKITFNCPVQIFEKIDRGVKEGQFGSKTDAVLTALRSYFKVNQ
jgi:metal-responsive CopG/Arc/MetJ family transcriptional regulator